MTEPRFIDRTMSSVIRMGAGRFGISAVVMMMSTSRAWAPKQRHLGLDEGRAHLLGVATATLAFFLDVQFEELGAHALDLVLDGGTRVERPDDRPKATGGANGREPGDAGADDQHLGRRHAPGRSHLTSEKSPVEARCLDHRAVAGDVRHRREGVHLLRPGDARDLVHREGGGLARGQALHEVLVLARPEERDQGGARTDQVGFVSAQLSVFVGRLDLENQLSLSPQRPGVGDDAGPRVAILVVAK